MFVLQIAAANFFLSMSSKKKKTNSIKELWSDVGWKNSPIFPQSKPFLSASASFCCDFTAPTNWKKVQRTQRLCLHYKVLSSFLVLYKKYESIIVPWNRERCSFFCIQTQNVFAKGISRCLRKFNNLQSLLFLFFFWQFLIYFF